MAAPAETPNRKRPRLLYLTAVTNDHSDDVLHLESRINVGVLSRDFDVSLAIVGPISKLELGNLRTTLGAARVTGGFEPSGADRPVDRGLKRVMSDVLGTDIVNARLQATIQRSAREFDAVLVDSLLAWPYQPVNVPGPTAYAPRELVFQNYAEAGFVSAMRAHKTRDYELDAVNTADMVFVQPELANALSEQGVPMRVLQYSYNRQNTVQSPPHEPDFNRTARRIGYQGYLGDERNVASLSWFLDNVWSVAAQVMPGVEFHVIGTAASQALREKLANYNNVILHWSSDDQALVKQKCRVVVDPLLYEDHVDAKLVNDMARGIPTVTTGRALKRSHFMLRHGAISADSRESMVLAINKLLSDPNRWYSAVRESVDLARAQLPAFELAHCIRRQMVQKGNHPATA